MNKYKEFVFEVVITKEISVKIPETYMSDKVIEDWEGILWTLDGDTPEEKLQDIAAYAAKLKALGYGDYSNDGVGKLYNEWGSVDFNENPYAVVAEELDEVVEHDLLEGGDWKNG